MFCHKCGKLLKDDSVFCNACGTKVVKPEETTPFSEVADITSFLKVDKDIPEKQVIVEQIPVEPVIVEPTSIPNDEIPEAQAPIEQAAEAIPETVIETTSEPVSKPVVENTPSNNAAPEQNPEFVQPDVQQPIPNIPFDIVKEQKKIKKPRSKGVRVTITACSVVMSILIGFLTISLIAQMFFTFGISDENITEAITGIDYTELKVKDVIDVDALAEQYYTEIPEDATIAQAIYHCIDQEQLVNPISEEEVELLVKRLEFDDFIAEKAAKAVKIAKDGSDEQPVTAEEIVGFLKDEKNKSYIETTIGIEILDVDYEYMEQYLIDNNDEYLNALTTENLTENIGSFSLGALRFYCSVWFVVFISILIIGFAVLIGFLKRRISSSLLYTGIPLVVAGLPPLAFGLLYRVILPSDFYVDIISPFMLSFIIICAVTVVLGAGMIATGIILNAFKKRKEVFTATPYQI